MPNLMVLPSANFDKMRLVEVPDDIEAHDAYRHVTGIVAAVQEDNPDCSWEDMQDALEAHGFNVLDYVLGPELVCAH